MGTQQAQAEQDFLCIASELSRKIIGNSNNAALGSAQEILNVAFRTSPPKAINAKYAHIELWTASAFNEPLLVLAASVFFRLESQGIKMAAAISNAIPK